MKLLPRDRKRAESGTGLNEEGALKQRDILVELNFKKSFLPAVIDDWM